MTIHWTEYEWYRYRCSEVIRYNTNRCDLIRVDKQISDLRPDRAVLLTSSSLTVKGRLSRVIRGAHAITAAGLTPSDGLI